jgi:PAS domain S-box-containing protein
MRFRRRAGPATSRQEGAIPLKISLLGSLVLCALIALLPVLGFQVAGEWDARRTRAQLVREEAMRLVSLVAAEQQRIAEGARQVLATLGAFPQALVGPGVDCEAGLGTLLSRFPRYSAAFLVGPDGRVICGRGAGAPAEGPADAAAVQEALRTGAFATGRFAAASGDGPPVVRFAQPYRDSANRIEGVIVLALSLDWLAGSLDQISLPPGATASVVDRDGTVLAQVPDGARFVGQVVSARARTLLQEDQPGLAEGDGGDDTQRVIAYARAGDRPDGLGVLVGLSTAEAFRDLDRANRRGVALIVSAALLSTALMALAAIHLVRRPAERLLRAVTQLARGDLSARTGLPADGSEFDRLGAAFDVMADRLQFRERSLRAALESTTDSVFVLDRSWRFTYLNRRAEAQIPDGRELVGQDFRAAFPDLEQSPFGTAYRAAMASGTPAHVDAVFAPTGRHLEAHAYPGAEGLTVFFRDVTDTRRAEQLLADSEEQFRTLAESIPQLAWMADGTGWVFWYNRRYYDYTGATLTEAQGWGWRAAHHPDHVARVVERISRSWRTGEPWEDTFPLRGRDGTWRWFLSRALPIRNEQGFVVRWFGTNTDITEQREAEALLERRVAERTAQLAASEQRFRAVFEHAADMVFVVRRTEAGRFAFEAVNPALARFLDRPEGEIIGRCADEAIGGRGGAELVACFAKCAALGHALRCETELQVGGEARTAEWALVPLPDAATGAVQVVGSARDMTARRALEQRLAKAQNLETVGQLTGGVAHDFNNLLQVIAGNIDLAHPAIRNGDAERAGRLLDNALRAIGRGARLTGQMLAFSGRQALRAEAVVAGLLVAGMGDLIRRAAGETIRVDIRTEPELWTCRIDPVQFESALLNLVLNARDAMSAGGTVRIALGNARLDAASAAAIEGLSPGDYVRVEVADTGRGMSREALAHAFEPFFTTKEIGRGSGLGLAQVHGFARQSGGGVAIRSETQLGTSVAMYFPRSAEVDAGADRSAGVAEPAATVLVVEDDAEALDAVQVMLTEAGLRVVPARDGPEALRVLHSDQTVDVMVSEVSIPGGISGVDLAGQARVIRPDLHVVLTADGAAARREGVAGCDVLTKPYRHADLLRRIARGADQRGV